MKVIPETRRDIYVFIQIVMVNNFTKRAITSQPFMEMQIYVKIKAFPNMGSVPYGV
jgi:hypothetical protein